MEIYLNFVILGMQAWVEAVEKNIKFFNRLQKIGEFYQYFIDKKNPPVLRFDYDVMINRRIK